MSASRSLDLALDQLGVGVGVLAAVVILLLVASPNEPTWALLMFPAVGLIYGAAGLVAWRRRPSNRMGALLIFGSFGWMLASLANVEPPVLVAVGTIVATVPIAVVVHLLHAFPSGRLPSRASRLIVAAVYFVTVVMEAPRYLFVAPASPYDLLTLTERPDLARWGGIVQSGLGAALVLATAVILVGRLRRADGPQRRVLGPLFSYGIIAVLFVPISANVLVPLLGLDPITRAVLQLAVLAGVPVAFAFSVLRGGFRRTGEIEELGAWLGTEGGVRPALIDPLAATLGDPSLELVFWVPEREGYVDSAVNADGDHVVFQVVEITPPEAATNDAAKGMVAETRQNSLYSDFMGGLRETSGMQVNRKALDSLLALGTSGN